MVEETRTVGAKCRTCGRQLTVEEFRACEGVGHYCRTHLAQATTQVEEPKPKPKRRRSGSARSNAGRKVSPSGAVEYACKAQFASDGMMRTGTLTSDHPSSTDGGVVFVCKDIGYGPGEVAMLFIKNPEGRAVAERAGFTCHE